MTMIQRHYTVRFLTPAFLGNAEQSGQWRTPPFKALLRQWWRVAVGQALRYNVDQLRRHEATLFGAASDREASKSLVRIRLSKWDAGKLTDWNANNVEAKVKHPEVQMAGGMVGSQLYLGYGPLTIQGGKTGLKKNAAIQAGDSATLSLAWPEEHDADMSQAIALMAHYGTLGGRSRNGWGSFELISSDLLAMPSLNLNPVSRSWQAALKLDWPHAIGLDDAGATLAWKTVPHDNWSELMKTLAEVKISSRTQFKFPNSPPPHAMPLDRHWLSYPITKHGVRAWNRNARLPNSLRFKARNTDDGKLIGVIFHIPCKPATQFRPDEAALLRVWAQMHQHLNNHGALTRIAA